MNISFELDLKQLSILIKIEFATYIYRFPMQYRGITWYISRVLDCWSTGPVIGPTPGA